MKRITLILALFCTAIFVSAQQSSPPALPTNLYTTPSNIGGGVPAGANGQVQFNNSGAFGANSGFVYNGSTVTPNVTITGSSNAGPQLTLGFGNGGTASIAFGGTGPTITDTNGATIGVSGPFSATALQDPGTAAATLTGTGACATFSGQVGGKLAGSAACASATAASTLTIGGLPAAAHGYVCGVQDETTRGNLFQQTSHTTTSCVLTITSVTQNDVFVFTAVGF